MGFGARLAEERKRLGLKQAEFAALVRTDVPKQSLYENDRRELRAAYLARLAAAKVDIGYVVTGRRGEGPWLDEETTGLLTAFLSLPPPVRTTILNFLGALEGYASSGPGRGAAPARRDPPPPGKG